MCRRGKETRERERGKEEARGTERAGGGRRRERTMKCEEEEGGVRRGREIIKAEFRGWKGERERGDKRRRK